MDDPRPFAPVPVRAPTGPTTRTGQYVAISPSPVIRDKLRLMLQAAGVPPQGVATASEVASGLQITARNPTRAVLIDGASQSDRTIIHTIETFRLMAPNLPIIVCTLQSTRNHYADCEANGATACLAIDHRTAPERLVSLLDQAAPMATAGDGKAALPDLAAAVRDTDNAMMLIGEEGQILVANHAARTFLHGDSEALQDLGALGASHATGHRAIRSRRGGSLACITPTRFRGEAAILAVLHEPRSITDLAPAKESDQDAAGRRIPALARPKAISDTHPKTDLRSRDTSQRDSRDRLAPHPNHALIQELVASIPIPDQGSGSDHAELVAPLLGLVDAVDDLLDRLRAATFDHGTNPVMERLRRHADHCHRVLAQQTPRVKEFDEDRPVQDKRLSVSRLFHERCDEWAPRLAAKGRHLQWHVEEDQEAELDPDLVRDALDEMIAACSGAVSRGDAIRATVRGDGEHVVFEASAGHVSRTTEDVPDASPADPASGGAETSKATFGASPVRPLPVTDGIARRLRGLLEIRPMGPDSPLHLTLILPARAQAAAWTSPRGGEDARSTRT